MGSDAAETTGLWERREPLGRKLRARAPPQLLRAPALTGQPDHLLALRARAFGIGRVRRGSVAALDAEKLLRPPGRRAGRRAEHRPELVAQHTIGATDYLLRHSLPISFTLVAYSSPNLVLTIKVVDQQGMPGIEHDLATY